MFSRFSKRVFSRAVMIAMALSLLSFTLAFAASGGLDKTFSGDGRVTTDIAGRVDNHIFGLAIQPDGKIVAVGDHDVRKDAKFSVIRYNPNGSLDKSFSNDGRQATNFGDRSDQAMDVAIQSDGKIVVSGTSNDDSGRDNLAVARYNVDGSLDTTFDGTGKVVIDIGGESNGSNGGIAIQSDGKIVIAGFMENSRGDKDFAVYRLKPNGALDTTFGGDGIASFGFSTGGEEQAYDLLLQGSKIVVVGEACDAKHNKCKFAIARLKPNGSLDAAFSGDGKQTTDFGSYSTASNVALQSGGKLVAIGGKWAPGYKVYCAVARYTSAGNLDTTFGSSGKTTIAAGFDCNGLVDKSNRIVLATSMSNGSNDDFVLFRLQPNGALDTTFSGDGKVFINFGKYESVGDIAMQADGKYLAGGCTFDLTGGQVDSALARVLP